MAWIYETVTPTLIPNTTVEKGFLNGVHKVYRITPNEGYVLHDKARDFEVLDPETYEPIGIALGYSTADSSCGAAYDFSPVTVTDENGVSFTAYGSREFAARLESDVPADQIFGGGNDHEIM